MLRIARGRAPCFRTQEALYGLQDNYLAAVTTKSNNVISILGVFIAFVNN